MQKLYPPRRSLHRQPQQKWYLSGAIPEAYQAGNDLSAPFHILRLVNVRIVPARLEIVP